MKNIAKKFDIFSTSEAKYMLMYGNGLIFLIILINIITVWFSTDKILEQSKTTLVEISKGYQQLVDKDYYCKSVKCRYIYQSEHNIIDMETYDIIEAKSPPNYIYENLNLYLPIFVDRDSFEFDIDMIEDVYYVNVTDNIYSILSYTFIIYTIILVIIYRMTRGILGLERSDFLTTLHTKETELQHKMLFSIAANINHEANSPLLVIRSVHEEIDYELGLLHNKCINPSVLSFIDTVKTMQGLLLDSVNSLDSVIEPLSDYRSVEFSNGDRNVYMLANTASEMVRRTNHKRFSYFTTVSIDKELEKYSVYHEDGMTNGFLLNNLINHIKNSLEASATELHVNLAKKDDEFLYIDIMDNGNGVPEELIESIYKKDITTKDDISEYKRGTGLFLNKLLITNKYHGDDYLVETIPKIRTVFRVKFKYEPYKYYNKRSNDEENMS